MSVITKAVYDRLVGDLGIQDLVTQYSGSPAVFTTDPVPEGARFPYIVTSGEVAQVPFDTKTTLGRELIRDIRIYASPSASAKTLETIAERVRWLFHRQILTVAGFQWLVSRVDGPIVANEEGAQGRILSLNMILMED